MAAAIRRNIMMVVGGAVLGIMAAGIYTAVRQPVYRATATLLMDPARPNVLASQQVTELPMIDSGFIDSATEIINADFIAQDVVSRLELGKDPEFTKPSGLRSLLAGMTGSATSQDAREADAAAASFITRNLDARRVGVSYVIEIKFSATKPETAARIANAVVDSYISTQAKARLDAAARASDWLGLRTAELRSKVAEADTEVQRYRTANKLEESAGKLPIEQQLSELTTKLSAARGTAAEAHVLAQQVRTLKEQQNFDAAAIAAVPDSTVRKVREKLVELVGQEAAIVERVGKKHQLAINAARDTETARNELAREVSNYQVSLEKSAQAADAAVASLQDEIATISANKSQSEEKAIALRELERNAESFRQLYETFMSRQKEVSQQQSFIPQDVRVAAEATPPIRPANKPLSMIFAAAMGLGLMAGVSAAVMRDRLDRTVRTNADAEEATERRVLATFGKISAVNFASMLSYVVTNPFSKFAEGFRHMRYALASDSRRSHVVIGVVSANAGEGATTIASNFGQYLAAAGVSVLMIDCNLRKPTLTNALCSNAVAGLPDALRGRHNWRSLLQVDQSTGFTLLPGIMEQTEGNPAELLSSPALAELLQEAAREYEVVLLDVADFANLVDARVVAPHVDKFVEVIHWGVTRRSDIQQALATVPDVHEKLAGVVLNMVETKSPRQSARRAS